MKLDVDINLEENDGTEQVTTTVTPEKPEILPKRPALLLTGGYCRPVIEV